MKNSTRRISTAKYEKVIPESNKMFKTEEDGLLPDWNKVPNRDQIIKKEPHGMDVPWEEIMKNPEICLHYPKKIINDRLLLQKFFREFMLCYVPNTAGITLKFL